MSNVGNEDFLSVLLPYILGNKKSKANTSGMAAGINFLTDPWLGVLTGTYDPLSQNQQQDVPDLTVYNDIVNDPNADKAALRIAQAIVEENQPQYKVSKEIDNMVPSDVYTTDDLKSLAQDLFREKESRNKAMSSSKGNDMFAKAGLPNITEQYSDNPDLAPFDPVARKYMSDLAQQAGSLRSQAKFETRNIAGANKKLASQNLNAEQIQKLLEQNAKQMMKGAGQTSRLKQDWSSILPFQTIQRIFDNPFNNEEPFLSTEGTIIDKTGRGKNEQVFKNYQKKEKELKSALAKAKQYETKYGKGSKAPINEVYGDLSDPKNLAKYFQIQSKIQGANKLEKAAQKYGSDIIGQAEAGGRTPTMDALAKRVLLNKLVGG
jgi:hypothetical protein